MVPSSGYFSDYAKVTVNTVIEEMMVHFCLDRLAQYLIHGMRKIKVDKRKAARRFPE